MNYIKIFISLLIITSYIFSQFTDVKINLNKDRLQKSINNELDNFETTIENYILNSEFAPDAMDIDFHIEFLFVFEGISDKGNQKLFNTQILATNGSDQQFFSKGVEFSYYPGQSLFYNSQFESLRSLIDYYCLMVIAGDLDTYDFLGGEKYYKIAEDIALKGKESSYNRGWDDRKSKSEFIKSNHSLRKAKLSFFIANDLYKTEDKNIIKYLIDFHKSIMDIDNDIGSDKDTKIFLKSHSKTIGLLLSSESMYSEILDLIYYYDDLNETLNSFIPKNYKK
tara:strand:- start:1756 stop:2598 length:843 start_codon:yes stop_codon:yes gene_type:complete